MATKTYYDTTNSTNSVLDSDYIVVQHTNSGTGYSSDLTQMMKTTIGNIRNGAQANVLEGISFKGSGSSSYSDLPITAKKAQLDLSAYVLNTRTINGNTLASNVTIDGSNAYLSPGYSSTISAAAPSIGDSIDTAVGKVQAEIEEQGDDIAEIQSAISGLSAGVTFKGNIDFASLPTPSASRIGWEYWVTDKSAFYICNGSDWFDVGATIIDNLESTDVNKALSANQGRILNERKAEIDGYYQDMTVGDAEQLVSTSMVEDDDTYSFRTAGGTADIGNRRYMEGVSGGSIAWHQVDQNIGLTDVSIVPYAAYPYINHSFDEEGYLHIYGGYPEDFTIQPNTPYYEGPANHVILVLSENPDCTVERDGFVNDRGTPYYMSKYNQPFSMMARIRCKANVLYDFKTRLMSFDLTIMFGSTIANYIYSLEQAHIGDGVAWFRRYFPEPYYDFCEPTLASTSLSAMKTVGFNAYNNSTGTAELIGGNKYQITGSYTALSFEGSSVTPDSDGFFTPEFSGTLTVTGGNSSDTCVHLVWSGYRNGEYEAYEEHEYPMDDGELRGVPSLDADNNLVFDGDEYYPDGSVVRKYGVIVYDGSDDEGWDWSDAESGWPRRCFIGDASFFRDDMICMTSRYLQTGAYGSDLINAGIGFNLSSNRWFTVADNAHQASLNDWKTYLSTHPFTFIYKLSTYSSDSYDPYNEINIVNDFGTESFVDAKVAAGTRDVSIPAGSACKYPANLRDKLQHLPNTASADGDYVITQESNQMTLKPIGTALKPVNDRIDKLEEHHYEYVTEDYNGEGIVPAVEKPEAAVDKVEGRTRVSNQLVNVVGRSWSHNGVTFTGNDDGSVTVNGTATGGDAFWLTTGTDTLTNGYVYLIYDNLPADSSWGFCANGTMINHPAIYGVEFNATILVPNGVAVSNQKVYPFIINLNKYFNTSDISPILGSSDSEIMATIRRDYPELLQYREYDADGTLVSSQYSGAESVGVNLWDGIYQSGKSINDETGAIESGSWYVTDYIRVDSNTTYYTCGVQAKPYFFDINKNYLGTRAGGMEKDEVNVTPSNCVYVIYMCLTDPKDALCINRSNPSINGIYHPYTHNTLSFPETVTLNSAGSAYDEYDPSTGVITRRVGRIICDSNTDWQINSNVFYLSLDDGKIWPINQDPNIIGAGYNIDGTRNIASFNNKTCTVIAGTSAIGIRDDSYSSVGSFKAAMIGKILTYELATPVTETISSLLSNSLPVEEGGIVSLIHEESPNVDDAYSMRYYTEIQYAYPNGTYPEMTVGTASNLSGRGSVSAEYTFRTSGGDADLGSGSAQIDRVLGNTLAWNQRIQNGNFTSSSNWQVETPSYATLSISNNTATVTPGSDYIDKIWQIGLMQNLTDGNIPSNHIYFLSFEAMYSGGNDFKFTTQLYSTANAFTAYLSPTFKTFSYITDRNDGRANFILYPEYPVAEGSYYSVRNVQAFDLTQMFGPGNEPATVAEFRSLFPLDYYDYNAGELINLKAEGIKTVGFNQFDGVLEQGGIDYNTGADVTNTSLRRSGYIKAFPLTNYYFKLVTDKLGIIHWYDSDKKQLGTAEISTAGSATSPANTAFMRFNSNLAADAELWDKTDICINLSWSGYRNGEYEPYWTSIMNLPITSITGKASGSIESEVIFPYGLLSAGNVHDEITGTKAIKRVGIADFGDFNYEMGEAIGYEYFESTTGISDWVSMYDKAAVVPNIKTVDFVPTEQANWYSKVPSIFQQTNSTIKAIVASAPADKYGTPSAFKSAMTGKKIYYELATPIEYTLDTPLNLNYRVDDFGTEQLLPENTSEPTTAPIIYDVQYAMNAVDTIRRLPNNYVSISSTSDPSTFDNFTAALASALGSALGGTFNISKSWDSTNEVYTFNISFTSNNSHSGGSTSS